ncbi:MAG: FeoB-associated Cys-rich membrane protein [Planctomycetes bacterium]|jgi:hypothetical protein|nr:FeoB-associated Cys-rich membrane protein [Planctomycetota bacterium]
MTEGILVGALVVLALVYLGRRAWRAWSSRGCGCEHCPTGKDQRPK